MSKRVLLIEDYPIIQKLYGDELKKHFQVDVVSNGEEALEQVGDHAYDFIFVDLLLPEVSGIDFLERYQDARPASTVIIVLSDFDYPETVDKAMSLGVDEYWMKVENTPSELTKKLLTYNRDSSETVEEK